MAERDADSTHHHAVSSSGHGAVKRHRLRRAAWISMWIAVSAIVWGSVLVTGTFYTDRPAFCATCHEMMPYYEAWASGTHSGIPCVECHVDPGLTARLAQKFAALDEVRAHFVGDVRFPRSTPADVKSTRCLRCHPDMPETTPSGFPHGTHARKGRCAACHPLTGHSVTAASLQAAGIYQPSLPPTLPAGAIAAVGAGSANVGGHVDTRCSDCHDLAKTGCKRCHTPKHKPRGDCMLCHRAGPEWKFLHPKAGVDCASCHKRPRNHTDEGDCVNCHDQPGRTWMHTHESEQDCATCHEPPAKHRQGACDQCHRLSARSWAFVHPSSKSNCRTCHQAPPDHYAGICTNCHHRVGASFAFKHPSAGEHSWRSRPCKKCHPSGTATVSCTCHGGNPPRD